MWGPTERVERSESRRAARLGRGYRQRECFGEIPQGLLQDRCEEGGP